MATKASGTGSASTCNILITASMCTLLARSRTGLPKSVSYLFRHPLPGWKAEHGHAWRRTDRLINRLITYSVQTGLATSVVEVIVLSTVFAYSYPRVRWMRKLTPVWLERSSVRTESTSRKPCSASRSARVCTPSLSSTLPPAYCLYRVPH